MKKINRRSPKENYRIPSKSAFGVGDEQDSSDSKDRSAERDLYFTFAKRSGNSVPNINEEMMEAENGLVFRPLFRTKDRGLRPRVQRSIKEEEKEDRMKPAETGIVYVPLFGAREKDEDKDEDKDRYRRSSDKNNVIGSPSDLQTAENIVFKPLIKNKQRTVRADSDSIFGSRLVFQNQYS